MPSTDAPTPVLSAGAPYALGSDFPVEAVNPFLGIYAAVTRKWADGECAGDSPHGEEGWCVFASLSFEAFERYEARMRAQSRCVTPLHRYPAERLTPLEALRGFTTSAAYAAFQADEVGSLAVGKHADFIVVDGDPLVLGTAVAGESGDERRERERRLREMKVLTTVVGGTVMSGRGF